MGNSVRDFLPSDRFEVRRTLGTGGMGVVYEAYDREQDGVVALKVLRDVKPTSVYRFKQVFRALTEVTHANLVSLYELVTEGDQWFFTMELVDGTHFLEHVRPAAGSGERARVRGPRGDGDHDVTDTIDFESPENDRGGTSVTQTPSHPPADESRLRPALRQLVEGVHALHRAGHLHRDIKPSNIVVTPDERVVLLDFGISTALAAPRWERGSVERMGTPAYVAPEQVASGECTEASDWYSVGVVLYEALTGTRPFAGTSQVVLELKQTTLPPLPQVFDAEAPADLSGLCLDLLRIEPEDRPSGEEVLGRVGAEVPARCRPAALSSSRAASGAGLIGREGSLERLRALLHEVRRGKEIVLQVHGDSGIGKSALARAFLDETAQDPEAVVLEGRCFERESVPYNAVDSLLDSLSLYLMTLPQREADSLLPRDIRLLADLFPVLRRVDAVVYAQRRAIDVADPHELRYRAFEALRELLGNLAAQRTVVLFIDDLQWGGADSAPLLLQMMRPPNPPPLLLILAFRTGDAERSRLLRRLLAPDTGLAGWSHSETLRLAPLSERDARELARALLPAGAHREAAADSVVRESAGNPFIIREIALLSASGQLDSENAFRDLTLQAVLQRRIEALPSAAVRLLQVVATAGKPTLVSVVEQAAQLESADRPSSLKQLRTQQLVRFSGVRSEDAVEPYHDRIREAVLQGIPAQLSRQLHRHLARSLEASGSGDAETLAVHYAAAGDAESAARHARKAADGAAKFFAFERAAELYRFALDKVPENEDGRSDLLRKLGDALASAGRGDDSARAYLSAAEQCGSFEALELRRCAAEQLLISGHTREGLDAIREHLREIGLAMPRTPRRALLSLLWHRLRFRLRGTRFREREEHEIAPIDLLRIDTCYAVAKGVSIVAPIVGQDFQTRGLLLSLRAGEPFRVAQALANEVAYTATPGKRSWQRVEDLIARAEEVVARVDHPYLRGLLDLTTGLAWYLRGRPRASLELCRSAERTLRQVRVAGTVWEIDTARYFTGLALLYLSRFRELAELLPPYLDDAIRRGDLYAEAQCRMELMSFAYLAQDQPELALEEARKCLGRLDPESFFMLHQWKLVSHSEAQLYQGDGEAAWQTIAEGWPRLKQSLLLHVHIVKCAACWQRARAALAAAAAPGCPAERRAAYLRGATRDARVLSKAPESLAKAGGALLKASVAAARGRKEAAVELLETADRLFERADAMPLLQHVARRRRGELLGGDEGAGLVNEANAWMQRAGCRSPTRWTHSSAPGSWWSDES